MPPRCAARPGHDQPGPIEACSPVRRPVRVLVRRSIRPPCCRLPCAAPSPHPDHRLRPLPAASLPWDPTPGPVQWVVHHCRRRPLLSVRPSPGYWLPLRLTAAGCDRHDGDGSLDVLMARCRRPRPHRAGRCHSPDRPGPHRTRPHRSRSRCSVPVGAVVVATWPGSRSRPGRCRSPHHSRVPGPVLPVFRVRTPAAARPLGRRLFPGALAGPSVVLHPLRPEAGHPAQAPARLAHQRIVSRNWMARKSGPRDWGSRGRRPVQHPWSGSVGPGAFLA